MYQTSRDVTNDKPHHINFPRLHNTYSKHLNSNNLYCFLFDYHEAFIKMCFHQNVSCYAWNGFWATQRFKRTLGQGWWERVR